MKASIKLAAAFAAVFALSGCLFGGDKGGDISVVEQFEGGVNPYLWRASLDTLENLPLESADPIGGIINYDWQSFPAAQGERIKATVYILDSRLRADGVKVAVFRQVEENGVWTDAAVDPATGAQLENAILTRARVIKSSELS
ncbi:DUF3576 domain-containing protein [Henriciella litoralis]|uniref:DUF3576 domain-containing protein n=1 Tax=Henriciella litoralis TaxID=568102 RepID=UPI000A040197|nr:DUF3576 domain-containing protein [Henriciella litoralis]